MSIFSHKHKLLFALSFSLLLLCGCQPSNDTNTNQQEAHMDKHVTIKLNESGDALAKRYPQYLNIDRQPAGLDFYDIDLDREPRGTATIEHGSHSFTIKDVLGVMGTLNHDYEDEGISEISISAGITPPEFISHDEARIKTYEILQGILNAGWRPVMYEGEPRLNGQDRLNYLLNNDDFIGLDPTFVPTLKEWMQIESSTMWYFYADHQYLSVQFKRNPLHLDPDKPGIYLLVFNLTSETQHYRSYVVGENRKDWQLHFKDVMENAKKERKDAEAELRAKGVAIDETYQDPPLPDLN